MSISLDVGRVSEYYTVAICFILFLLPNATHMLVSFITLNSMCHEFTGHIYLDIAVSSPWGSWSWELASWRGILILVMAF